MSIKTIFRWNFLLVLFYCFELKSEIASSNPDYLYKILSLKNWQTSQNRKSVYLSSEDSQYIHLATEDQLDKIILKYYKDASELAILKLQTDRLKGNLTLETNPGGTTSYYHLYNGLIPFKSIVECKIVYQKPLENIDEKTAELSEVGNPILREVARDLLIDEIKSDEIQELIQIMKDTMRLNSGVGLAAPQIGKPYQIAVIEDHDLSFLPPEKLEKMNRYPVPFHVIINPKLYIEADSGYAEFFEGCLSVPEFMGVIKRATKVKVECLDEHGEPITIHATGWYARILQHEIDHLNGKLYLDTVDTHTLMTIDSFTNFHKNKSIEEIQACLKSVLRTVD